MSELWNWTFKEIELPQRQLHCENKVAALNF